MTAAAYPNSSDVDPTTDAHIVASIRAGSETGVRKLLEGHGARVKSLLRGRFGKKHEAAIDNAITDAACAIWSRAAEFDPDRGSLGAWFYACARNALLITLRAERARPLLESLDLLGLHDARVASDIPRSQELLYRVDAAIGRLSDIQRDIFFTDLAQSGEVKDDDLALKWGTTKNSIHVSRHKAYKRLARMLRRRT